MSGRKAQEPGSEFVKLLDYLKATRGFDFSGYKLSSLIRRVERRMQQVGCAGYADYIDYLEVHADEFLPLFNTVLINVTGFFRDPAAWQTLAEKALPALLAAKGASDPIRCWCAGCASGEEAFTLAMLLAEALGEPEFRQRVKIYATDADEEALAAARQASYTAAQVEGIPADLLARYFEHLGERHVFRVDLRRTLVFGRHDLVQDAAISRIDLLTCRNTLMYFNAETQAKILARFHFALNRDGYLFLGKAETLLSHSNSFRPADLKARIFQRTPSANLTDRLLAIGPANSSNDGHGVPRNVRIREAAFDTSPVAQVVFDRRGHLVLASEKARRLFGLVPADVGRLLQELEVSYRPVELRSHVETAAATRLAVTLKDVEWRTPDGESRTFEVQVTPLPDRNGTQLGTGITFLDLTLAHRLRQELERANQELETASEELQSANEELETTNEELQSTIEELETTNEEMQSANEELETMNEELQSTNDELRGLNDQLRQRSQELDRANAHLHSILTSLRAAVVVLNPALEVEIWSEKARDLWGLRADEAEGQPFFGLDIGLPLERLLQRVRQCQNDGAGGGQQQLDAVDRRGRPIRCEVTCTRVGTGPEPAGVVLLMETSAAGDETREV
jgi:two-component system, chemotaxis family, CheB/CheR fusion protein